MDLLKNDFFVVDTLWGKESNPLTCQLAVNYLRVKDNELKSVSKQLKVGYANNKSDFQSF